MATTSEIQTEEQVRGAKQAILKMIAAAYNRADDKVRPNDLPFEIQYRLGCTWGRALSYANEIRCGKR